MIKDKNEIFIKIWLKCFRFFLIGLISGII